VRDMSLSIRQKVAVLVSTIVICMSASIGAIYQFGFKSEAREEVYSEQYNFTNILAQSLNVKLNRMSEFLEDTGNDLDESHLNSKEKFIEYCKIHHCLHAFNGGVYISDLKGKVLVQYGTDLDIDELTRINLLNFEKIKLNGAYYYMPDKGSILFSRPLYTSSYRVDENLNAKTRYYMMGILKLDSDEALLTLNSHSIGKGGYFYILSKNADRVITSKNVSLTTNQNYKLPDQLKQLLHEPNTGFPPSKILIYPNLEGIPSATTVFPLNNNDWYLFSAVPINLLNSFLGKYDTEVIVVFLIGSLLLITLIMSMLKQLLKPIESISQNMKLIRTDEYTRVDVESTQKEINDLIKTYNEMIDDVHAKTEKAKKILDEQKKNLPKD
jgi:hypothetical protein